MSVYLKEISVDSEVKFREEFQQAESKNEVRKKDDFSFFANPGAMLHSEDPVCQTPLNFSLFELLKDFDLISSTEKPQFYSNFNMEIEEVVTLYRRRKVPNAITEFNRKRCNIFFINHKLSLFHLFENLISALESLCSNGHIVLQTYMGYTPSSMNVIYIISSFFEQVFVYKPSVDYVSLTRYFVFKYYKGGSIERLKEVLGKINEKVSKIFDVEIPKKNKRELERCNEDFVDMYQSNTEYIETIKNDDMEKYLKNNIQYCVDWCHQNGFVINPKYELDNLITDFNPKEYFPLERDIDYSKIQMTKESLFSISKPRDADIISKIIIKNVFTHTKNLVITDATANIGGNAINFAYYFKNVNAVEVSPFHSKVLENNVIKVFKRNNVTIFNKNYMDICHLLKQDVVFIDAPWGGKEYKAQGVINICLSGIPLYDVVNKIKENTKLIVIKVPMNFDIQKLLKKTDLRKISINRVRNYSIVIIKTEYNTFY